MKMSKFNEIWRLLLNISFFSRMVQMGRCFLTMCTTPVHEDKNIKQMCRYKKENGRSMVEMLGVLAIALRQVFGLESIRQLKILHLKAI